MSAFGNHLSKPLAANLLSFLGHQQKGLLVEEWGSHGAPNGRCFLYSVVNPQRNQRKSEVAKVVWLNMLWITLVAGRLEERQRVIIDFLITMIQAQPHTNRELNHGRGRRLSHVWRRKLAVKARLFPNEFFQQVAAFTYSPETFLRWYRTLVAQKYAPANTKGRRGRPGTDPETVALVIRFASENPGWGLRRIVGELKKVGIGISKSTVSRILTDYGLEPAPKRCRTWQNFLSQQWQSMAAADFFTVEVLHGWGV